MAILVSRNSISRDYEKPLALQVEQRTSPAARHAEGNRGIPKAYVSVVPRNASTPFPSIRDKLRSRIERLADRGGELFGVERFWQKKHSIVDSVHGMERIG